MKIFKEALFAVVIILIIIFLSFIYNFSSNLERGNGDKNPLPGMVCTQEAKRCSDGSYVSRGGPMCEFAECPIVGTTTRSVNIQTATSTKPVAHVTITYTKQGFIPMTVTIKKGQIVDFVNTSNKAFWPASNDHPAHTIYPEFDSRTPIAPSDKYSFQFTKVGSWKFHNHMNEDEGGVVNVTE